MYLPNKISLWLCFLCILCNVTMSFAQNPSENTTNKYTISGYVKDKDTGESLIGANVIVLETKQGAVSNDYGYYSIRLSQGNYTLLVNFSGYLTDTITVQLNTDKQFNVNLRTPEAQLNTVVIEDARGNANVSSTEMGKEKLDMAQVKTMPALFGEVDVLRTIQLLPGVKTAGDGSNSFFVRGGNYDQNLITLDGATVYNASHLGGLFSVFNSDAVKDATLYKGAIPAYYGGRLSSVLDIRMNEGSDRKFGVKAGIGSLSSRLMVEGPIKKEKGGFLITARRSYADIFLALSSDSIAKKSTLYFYDLNAKAHYRLGEKDQIFVSGYIGRDVFELGDQFGLNWGNATATLRWNHLFTNRLFSNLTLLFSDFFYGFSINAGDNNFKASYESGIREAGAKINLDYFITPEIKVKFGGESSYLWFNSGEIKPVGENSVIRPLKTPTRYGLQTAVYANVEHKISSRLTLEYGFRYANFLQMGEGTKYRFDETKFDLVRTPIDSTVYSGGQVMQAYHSPEPRVAGTFRINEVNSVKASYTRTGQFIHVASNSNAGLPTDLWVPSTSIIKPEFCDQISAGYYRNLKDNMFEISVEGYYKWLHNQIEFRNDANIFLNKYIEGEFVIGKGWTYGAEFLLKKTKGKFTGWFGYTLSWSWRQFDNPYAKISNQEAFYARNDRRHDFSLVMNYKLNQRWTFAANWVFYSGLAFTAPTNKYTLDGRIIGQYTGRNNYRFPVYHRADLSATLYSKEKPNQRFKWNINFSVFNLYGRANPWSIQFDSDAVNGKAKKSTTIVNGQPQEVVTPVAVMTYLFSVVPSVTFNFEF